MDTEITKENEQDEINEGEKNNAAVKKNMIVDEVKIEDEFPNKIKKLKNEKKDLRATC